LFYVLTIAVIGLVIPYTHPNLISGNIEDVAVSPFTLVFERAGIAFAASIINAVILTSVLSAGNSGMYAATRLLWTMANEGKAPKFLTKLNKHGIPVYALYLTTGVGMLVYLVSLFGDGTAFIWLLNASGLCGFIAWFGIAWSHYRFRKGYEEQGYDLKQLPYRAKWYPLGPILTCVLCLFIIIGQNYQAFTGNEIDWKGIAVTYIGIPLFLLLWFGYKYVKKTTFVSIQKMSLKNRG
jgi:lysine-specific permease